MLSSKSDGATYGALLEGTSEVGDLPEFASAAPASAPAPPVRHKSTVREPAGVSARTAETERSGSLMTTQM